MSRNLDRIEHKIIERLCEIDERLERIERLERRILKILSPVAGMVMTIQGDEMATKAKKAGLDFQMFDNGSATATLSFIDAAGLPTTLPAGSTAATTWTSSDPSIVATGSADGLSAALAPSVPPVLATGVVISASTVVTNSDGSSESFTASGDPIDVIAGGPAGMQIVEQ